MIAPEEEKNSGYNQKMHERKFFMLVRVRFEKPYSEVRKKIKTLTFEVSTCIKKWKMFFLMHAHAIRAFFFWLKSKILQMKKQVSEVQKS